MCDTHAPGAGKANKDAWPLLRVLDVLEPGLAFFDCTGALRHANRPLALLLEEHGEGERLRRELDLFARALWDLVRLRGRPREETAVGLAVREISYGEGNHRLKGSYLGLGVFDCGGCVLIVLEAPPSHPLSEERLRQRFSLTRQESRIVRLLLAGHSNAEIARRLSLSRHTVRHHLERIFQRLQVRSRTELAARVLRAGETAPDD